MSAKEAAAVIADIKKHLPGCVQEVLIRADGEFSCWQSVQTAMTAGFDYIIANRGCTPVFDADTWYRPFKRKQVEYNSCIYRPGDRVAKGPFIYKLYIWLRH